jgi:hypothetical protein
MDTRDVVDWEVLGGPYDGSALPGYGTQIVVRWFDVSPTSYLYRRACDDDGAPYWQFVGTVAPLASAA